jgi:hypothetical protein
MDVQLDAVAVELDLVNPAIAGRHLVARGRQRGFDETGEGRLHADRRRLLALKRHATKLHTKADSNWHRSNRSGREKLEGWRIMTRCHARIGDICSMEGKEAIKPRAQAGAGPTAPAPGTGNDELMRGTA